MTVHARWGLAGRSAEYHPCPVDQSLSTNEVPMVVTDVSASGHAPWRTDRVNDSRGRAIINHPGPCPKAAGLRNSGGQPDWAWGAWTAAGPRPCVLSRSPESR
jgi:hypothetical protein